MALGDEIFNNSSNRVITVITLYNRAYGSRERGCLTLGTQEGDTEEVPVKNAWKCAGRSGGEGRCRQVTTVV